MTCSDRVQLVVFKVERGISKGNFTSFILHFKDKSTFPLNWGQIACSMLLVVHTRVSNTYQLLKWYMLLPIHSHSHVFVCNIFYSPLHLSMFARGFGTAKTRSPTRSLVRRISEVEVLCPSCYALSFFYSRR